jgi:hypothetical protein
MAVSSTQAETLATTKSGTENEKNYKFKEKLTF